MDALLQAWMPMQNAWKGIWWDCIAVPKDVDDNDQQAVLAFRTGRLFPMPFDFKPRRTSFPSEFPILDPHKAQFWVWLRSGDCDIQTVYDTLWAALSMCSSL